MRQVLHDGNAHRRMSRGEQHPIARVNLDDTLSVQKLEGEAAGHAAGGKAVRHAEYSSERG